jgi:predicted glutamine amidotransferase
MTIKPRNVSIPDYVVSAMFRQNSDGIGVAYSENGRIMTFKHLPATAKDAVEYIHSLDLHGKEAVIHFRYATHGVPSVDNTHPFQITGTNLVLFHNGVLNTDRLSLEYGEGTDTFAYVEKYLSPILRYSEEIAFQRSFADMIGEHVGHSKFIILSPQGDTIIVNEHLGEYIVVDQHEVWVSNLHWDLAPKMSAGYELPFMGWSDAEEFIKELQDLYREHGGLSEWLDLHEAEDFYKKDPNKAWEYIEKVWEGSIDCIDLANYVNGDKPINGF